VEIIAALTLLGVLTAVFGMGLVAAARSVAFSRENTIVAQRGQMAMARISRELMELTAIRHIVQSEGVDPYIIYERTGENTQDVVRYALRYDRDADEIRLHTGVTGDILGESDVGDLLANGVTRFDLSFFQGADEWNISDDFALLSTIGIEIEWSRRDAPADPQLFSTRVHLRKTPYISLAPPPGSCAFAGLFPVLGAMGRRFRRKRRSSRGTAGSVLVVVIVSLLIFAALAAAIIPMVSSSSQQVAVTDASAKALYLAESGFRYVESRWNPYDTEEPSRHNALDELDGNYTLIRRRRAVRAKTLQLLFGNGPGHKRFRTL
jgi:hypothetical protein